MRLWSKSFNKSLLVCFNVNKIKGKLQFLHKKNRYLTKELHRMLCTDLIQPHFDYACPVWYFDINEKTRKKIEIMQNKCIGTPLPKVRQNASYI